MELLSSQSPAQNIRYSGYLDELLDNFSDILVGLGVFRADCVVEVDEVDGSGDEGGVNMAVLDIQRRM